MSRREDWRLAACIAIWLTCLPACAQDVGSDGSSAVVKPNPLGVLDTSKFNDKALVSPYPELLKGPLPSADEASSPEPATPEPAAPAADKQPAPAPQPSPAPAGPDATSAALPTGSVAQPATTPIPDAVPTAAATPVPSPETSATTVTKEHDKAWSPVEQPIDTVDAQRFRQKARAAIAIGDIAAARALLDGLAARRDPEASFLLAQTYDPEKLNEWGVVGVDGDKGRASNFYRRASEGGYPAPGNGSFK